MPGSFSAAEAARVGHEARDRRIVNAEIRLLYTNSAVAVWVTLVAVTLLGYLQWAVVSHQLVLSWALYMVLVSAARFALARRYWGASQTGTDSGGWGAAFAAGAALAGAGWGAAGILLYPQGHLTNQVFLVFVLGGMMLGAASLLAPRPEAFLAFLIPAGFAPASRLLLEGDETHAAMGLLAVVFTIATLVTTWRMYRMIDSALALQFENRGLVESLQAAKAETDLLNQQLEFRVAERTAELNASNQRLRAEIKQREQMEEELLRARKLESLGVLAGGIAHDFNNFLTVVQGNIEMAKLQAESGGPVHEMLDDVARACEGAASLSSQLLTFAKGGAPVRRVVSVSKLVEDAVHLARAGAPISIDVSIAQDLWFAEVDPGQIGQVLHNILLNARQAMPEGGIIEVRAENVLESNPGSGPGVMISVRDYGRGIPAEVLPRIFDPYFTTKPGASGLGMATAYAIITKHGGRIGVDSASGGGTVFTIVLPASQERPAPEERSAPEPWIGGMQQGTVRLLVMDDEAALRKLLETVLTRLGYEVQSARDGAEAIAVYEAAKASGRGFDAVLLDLTVRGGMGGIETAAKIRELDSSVRLIVSSGYSDAAVMSRFRDYGFDDVIPKPWSPAELSEVFRRVLASDPDRKTN
ncbi:MAG TPA: ATP-binding protein [Bryobacteraceae bacterium]|nr:ATP-binding protein [Bryobacteraceae bacterium]